MADFPDKAFPHRQLSAEDLDRSYAEARGLPFVKKSQSPTQPPTVFPGAASRAEEIPKASAQPKKRPERSKSQDKAKSLERLTIRLSREMIESFEEMARQEDRTFGWVIRRALEDYHRKTRRKAAAEPTHTAPESPLNDETSES